MIGRKVSFLLLPLLVTAGCADQKARIDISRLESSLNDMRSFQAEQTTKISAIETDLRTLSGRVDELEFQQNQRLGTALSNLKSDISQLRRRVPPPAIVPVQELEHDENALAQLPAELAAPLGEAFGSMRDGNFERAQVLLEDSLSLAIGTDWVPLVLFWRGITFEGLNNNNAALENYLEIASKFSKYERVPTVLWRQASVLIRLNDKKSAKVVLTKLITDYPRSAEAQRARDRLKELK